MRIIRGKSDQKTGREKKKEVGLKSGNLNESEFRKKEQKKK